MQRPYLVPKGDDSAQAHVRACRTALVTLVLQAARAPVHKMLTLRGSMPRETTARLPLCADIDGSSLHAAVRVDPAAAPLQQAFELTQPE